MTIDAKFVDDVIGRELEAFPNMREMTEYAVFGGGKRLRPMLLLNVALAVGKIDQNIQKLATALELIHSYSLVHDDLPCMDNDDYRRGRPTVHKNFGEANAVLTGDVLLNMAAEVALGGDFSVKNYAWACRNLFHYAGSFGMAYGQYLDLNEKIANCDDAVKTATFKTAALFRAAMVCPAVYFGLCDEEIADFSRLAGSLGCAFQFADDLSDGDGDSNSAVTAVGRQETKKLVLRYCAEAREVLSEMKYDLGFVAELVDKIEKSAL